MKRTLWVRGVSAVAALLMALGMAGCGNVGQTTSEVWEEEIITIDGSTVTQTGDGETESGENGDGNEGTASVNSQGQTSGGGGGGGNTTTTQKVPDFRGATLKIASWGSKKPKTSSPTYRQQVEQIAAIEEKFNCKIQFIDTANDSLVMDGQVATATAAGTKYADLLQMTSDNNFPRAALKGFLHPMDKYVDLSSSQWNKRVLDMTEIKGRHYYLPSIYDCNAMVGNGIFFNKKTLQRLGLKTPHDYIKSGNWNWDTFEELAKSATQRNGGVQYYGLERAPVLFDSNGVALTKMVNGKAVFNYEQPAAYEAISFAQKLYHTDKVVGGSWEDGTAAMWASAWYMGEKYLEKLGASGVGFAYCPIGPRMNDYYYIGQGGMPLWGILVTVKNPADVAQVLVEYTKVEKWKPDAATTLSSHFGDEYSLEIAVDCVNRAMQHTQMIGYYALDDIVGDWGVKANTSPQGFIASVKGQVQDKIDAVWDPIDTFKPKD